MSVHDVALSVEMYVSLYVPPPHAMTLVVPAATVVGVPDAELYVKAVVGKAQPWRIRGFHGGDGCWLNRTALATVAIETNDRTKRDTRMVEKRQKDKEETTYEWESLMWLVVTVVGWKVRRGVPVPLWS